MKLKKFKVILFALGLFGASVLTPTVAPVTQQVVIAAEPVNTLDSFFGSKPMDGLLYIFNTKKDNSTGKYIIVDQYYETGYKTINIQTPLYTNIPPQKIRYSNSFGSGTINDGEILFVNINGKKAWRYVVKGVVQTKFNGWVINDVLEYPKKTPEFIKYKNGVIDTVASMKGPLSAILIQIDTLNYGLKGEKINAKKFSFLNPTDKGTIKWSSSNTKVATVDSNGIISFKNKGNVTIKAQLPSGSYSTKNITVYDAEDETIVFSNASTPVYVGETRQLKGKTVKYSFPVRFTPGGPLYSSGLYEGTINGKSGRYYITNAAYNPKYTGFAKNDDGWWYVEKGTVTGKYNGKVKGSIDGKTDTYNVVNSKVEQNIITGLRAKATNGCDIYYSKIKNVEPKLHVTG